MWKYSLFIVLVLAAAVTAGAASDPVAILQSSASVAEKAEACRLISLSGDVNALPVLAPMLADPELSHMARYALEPMPGTGVDAVLREALKTTSGTLRAGVVSSLGVRRDAAAVPEIVALLNDEDGSVKEAAARALGRIGTPEGVDALRAAINNPGLAYAFAQALADGLFGAAEHFTTEGQKEDAARIYREVYAAAHLPVHLRAGALRGVILSGGPEGGGITALLEAIQGEDADFFNVALRAAQEMAGKRKTAMKLAALLPSLSPERKVPVIQLLGELGKKKAGPALLKEAESGPTPVRVAALNAAVRLAYAPALPLITGLVTSEETALAAAARNGLAYFPGEKGDASLKNLLKSDDAQVRRVAVELVGEGAASAVDLLMEWPLRTRMRPALPLKGAKEYAGRPRCRLSWNTCARRVPRRKGSRLRKGLSASVNARKPRLTLPSLSRKPCTVTCRTAPKPMSRKECARSLPRVLSRWTRTTRILGMRLRVWSNNCRWRIRTAESPQVKRFGKARPGISLRPGCRQRWSVPFWMPWPPRKGTYGSP